MAEIRPCSSKPVAAYPDAFKTPIGIFRPECVVSRSRFERQIPPEPAIRCLVSSGGNALQCRSFPVGHRDSQSGRSNDRPVGRGAPLMVLIGGHSSPLTVDAGPFGIRCIDARNQQWDASKGQMLHMDAPIVGRIGVFVDHVARAECDKPRWGAGRQPCRPPHKPPRRPVRV